MTSLPRTPSPSLGCAGRFPCLFRVKLREQPSHRIFPDHTAAGSCIVHGAQRRGVRHAKIERQAALQNDLSM